MTNNWFSPLWCCFLICFFIVGKTQKFWKDVSLGRCFHWQRFDLFVCERVCVKSCVYMAEFFICLKGTVIWSEILHALISLFAFFLTVLCVSAVVVSVERDCNQHEILLLFVLSQFIKPLCCWHEFIERQIITVTRNALECSACLFFVAHVVEPYFFFYVSKLLSGFSLHVFDNDCSSGQYIGTKKGLVMQLRFHLPPTSFWSPLVPQPPTITHQSPKDYIIDPRENIIIHCEAKGKPHPR